MRSFTLLSFCCILAVLSLAVQCNKDKNAYPKFITEMMEAKPEKTEIRVCTNNNKQLYIVNKCVGCPDYLIEVVNKKQEKVCQVGGIAGMNTCKVIGLDIEKDCKVIYTAAGVAKETESASTDATTAVENAGTDEVDNSSTDKAMDNASTDEEKDK